MHSSPMKALPRQRGIVLRWAITAGISLSLAAPFASAATQCPQQFIARAASEFGYRPHPSQPYCEGLLREDNSASLQVFSFVTFLDPLLDVKTLHVYLPGTPGNAAAIRGSSSSRGVPYRFDAALTGGREVAIDLGAVVRPARIDLQSLGFVATKKLGGQSDYMLPVVIATSPVGTRKWIPEYVFIVRPSQDVSRVAYQLLDESGKVNLDRIIQRFWPAGTPIALTLSGLAPGRYQIRVQASTSQEDALLSGRVELPAP